MPDYRATVRYGGGRQQYEVVDVRADSVADALRRVADRLRGDVATTADLVELRVQSQPEARDYAPG